jgi:hypothetical protein
MNTITIELCKEDRKRIDEVIAFLGLIAGELKSRPSTVEQTPAPVVATDPDNNEYPVTLFSEPAPVAETEPEVKPVSLAEFQKAVTLAVSKGADAKKAAKEIINKYAASVSAVPEDKRAEVMAELANI